MGNGEKKYRGNEIESEKERDKPRDEKREPSRNKRVTYIGKGRKTKSVEGESYAERVKAGQGERKIERKEDRKWKTDGENQIKRKRDTK